MDRIEFIEQLAELIEEQTIIRDTLLKEKDVAYTNSLRYLRKVLNEDYSTLTISTTNNITLGIDNSWPHPKTKKTTTRVIITESHKLCTLEEECASIQKEIDAYRSDAIDLNIPFFRRDNNEL